MPIPLEWFMNLFSALYLVVMAPSLLIIVANLISNVRMLDRWVYGNL